MASSLQISAGFFKREGFLSWDPETAEFGTVPIVGRKGRADRFVSLWNRSTRRSHLFLDPTTSLTSIVALKHTLSNDVYVVSETIEREFDYGQSSPYDLLVRAHRVTYPSGGACLHKTVSVSGTGDDLGAVVIGAGVPGWADVELRTAMEPDGSRLSNVGEYLVTYSRNLSVSDDDILVFDEDSYIVLEPFPDSGFRSVRALQDDPKYVTVQFKLPSTASTFDAATGVLTGGSTVTRDVSCFIDQSLTAGDTSDHVVQNTLKLFIYKKFIGFVPTLGQQVVYNGRTYRVTKLSTSLDGKQYELEVKP